MTYRLHTICMAACSVSKAPIGNWGPNNQETLASSNLIFQSILYGLWFVVVFQWSSAFLNMYNLNFFPLILAITLYALNQVVHKGKCKIISFSFGYEPMPITSKPLVLGWYAGSSQVSNTWFLMITMSNWFPSRLAIIFWNLLIWCYIPVVK